MNSQAPSAAPQEPVHVSGGIIAGTILTKGAFVLSPDVKARGTVVFHAIIGKDGHVETLSVISGPEMLRSACLDAVRQWTYRPYLLNGNPVEVDTTITIRID
jgi:periplasmic protein TonB